MRYLTDPFRKTFVFSGRATRKEYWMFLLVLSLTYFVAGAAFVLLSTTLHASFFGLPIVVLGAYGLWAAIAQYSLTVRRLHDMGRSGWWGLLVFTPFIGGLVSAIFGIIKGQPEANEYGLSPYTEVHAVS